MGLVGKILVAGVVMFIVVGMLAVFDLQYGNSGQSLNNTNAQSYKNFTGNVYDPLLVTTSNGLSGSNNLAGSSSAGGFSYAFIFTGLANVYTEVIQAPQLMAADWGQALQALQLPGVNVQVYVVAIEGLFGVFLALLFVSAWMKFPLT